ncbi:hypothetical protein C8R45DRAFT_400007 [Mycena sanguinolenta]|nr:hypothetical protein C8R45DRAFT_400007 [Mycena sanguinolenta]
MAAPLRMILRFLNFIVGTICKELVLVHCAPGQGSQRQSGVLTFRARNPSIPAQGALGLWKREEPCLRRARMQELGIVMLSFTCRHTQWAGAREIVGDS